MQLLKGSGPHNYVMVLVISIMDWNTKYVCTDAGTWNGGCNYYTSICLFPELL